MLTQFFRQRIAILVCSTTGFCKRAIIWLSAVNYHIWEKDCKLLSVSFFGFSAVPVLVVIFQIRNFQVRIHRVILGDAMSRLDIYVFINEVFDNFISATKII